MPTVEERLAYLEGQSEQQNVSTSDLRSSLGELRVEVRDLRAELRTEIRDVRVEIRDLRTDMNQKFTWVMGIQVSTVVMIAGALLGLFFRARF
jgi:predicted  nucleic acid-binding Zn-ribbon protein